MKLYSSHHPRLIGARAFTLIELLTVIAIIGVLAAILIPTVGAVRNKARQSACLSNVRQIGMALIMYGNENKGFGPPTGGHNSPSRMLHNDQPSLFGLLLPYLGQGTIPERAAGTPPIFMCQAIAPDRMAYLNQYSGYETAYFMNMEASGGGHSAITPLRHTVIPPRRVVITDYCHWFNPRPLENNHKGEGMNVFRMNGSASWIPTSKTKGLATWLDMTKLDDI